MTSDEILDLPEELQHYILQIDEDLFIGPRNFDSVDEAEFFNHSCNPNCGIRGQIALVAMRDILPGEELTFDYAMGEAIDQPWECSCGAPDCRGRITAEDHNDAMLRHRYRGYFSQWLEKKHGSLEHSETYLRQFNATGAWGLVTALDLHGCNPETIRSKEKIYEFTIEVCERIKVKRYGEPVIVHFGEDERVAGYSLVQLIETSLVSGHFANLTNSVYLDVFSCAYYDPHEAARYAAEFFGAKSYNINVYLRH